MKGPVAWVIAQLLGLGWLPQELDRWTSSSGVVWEFSMGTMSHVGALLQEVQRTFMKAQQSSGFT